jgi:N-acetylneuraminic acid mutarotase
VHITETLRRGIAVLLAVLVAAVLLPAAASASPATDALHASRAESTLRGIAGSAQKTTTTTAALTSANLSTGLASYAKANAWEKGVDFALKASPAYSGGFGVVSYAFDAKLGTTGLAMRNVAGNCSLAYVSRGSVANWTWPDLGENCAGVAALRGRTGAQPGFSEPGAPGVPSGLVAASGNELIDLSWARTTDADLDHYEVLLHDGTTVNVSKASTTRRVSGLENGTEYCYQVRSVDANGTASAWSNTACATPEAPKVPATPLDLAATPGDTKVNLSWGGVLDETVTGYNVFVDGVLLTKVTERTYTVTGLTNDREYSFEVSAVRADGAESPRAGPALATPRDMTPPPVPTNLRLVSAGLNNLNVAWNSVSAPDLDHYNVYVNGTFWGRTTATGTTLSITGLKPGTSYVVTVSSVDKTGNESAQSAPLSATTTRDTTAPAAPRNLAGTPGDTTVSLKWNAGTEPDLKYYDLYRSGGGASTQLIARVPVGTTTYLDTNLVNGTEYTYYLRAVDESGNQSSSSNYVYVTPRDSVAPGKPTDLTAVMLEGSSEKATSSWKAPADTDLRYFKVYSNGTYLGRSTNAATLTYALSGLLPGTTYVLEVSALDLSGNEGPKSDPFTLVTPPQQPGTSFTTGVAASYAEGSSVAYDKAGNVYVTGGRSSSDTGTTYGRRFNAATQAWENLPSLPNARMYHTSAVDDKGRLFLFGGRNVMRWQQITSSCCTVNAFYYDGSFLNSVDMYDPATGKWTTMAGSMPSKHANGASIVTNPDGTFVIIGGLTSYSNYNSTNLDAPSSSVDKYNPATNTWTVLASLPAGRSEHASVVDSQGRVYVVGGTYQYTYDSARTYRSLEFGATTASTYRYDPATNRWTQLGSLPNRNGYGGRYLGIAVDPSDRVTVVGGRYEYGSNQYNYNSDIQRIEPGSSTWTTVGNLPYPASKVATAVDASGSIWVFGGETFSGVQSRITRISPSGTPTVMGDVKQPRALATAVLEPSGTFHLVSGQTWSNGVQESDGRFFSNYSSSVAAEKAERYKPAS